MLDELFKQTEQTELDELDVDLRIYTTSHSQLGSCCADYGLPGGARLQASSGWSALDRARLGGRNEEAS